MWYSHYSQVSYWPWRNFAPKEIASKGDESLEVDEDALNKLQLLRDLMGCPLILNSAYRDRLHNARVGGAPRSMHKYGRAFDVRLGDFDKQDLLDYARAVGFTGIGFYGSFLHIDTGKNRQWWSDSGKKVWRL